MMLPNRLIHSYLNALDDLLGKNGVNTILNHSSLSHWIEQYPPEDSSKGVPFDSFSKIQASLEDIYGERTGQNLSRRASRTSIGSLGIELSDPDLLVNSEGESSTGVKEKLNGFVSLFDDETGAVTWTSEAEKILIHFQVCPSCINRKAQTPICHACAGWIEGFISFLEIGYTIEVTETSCLAKGDKSCTFEIQPG